MDEDESLEKSKAEVEALIIIMLNYIEQRKATKKVIGKLRRSE